MSRFMSDREYSTIRITITFVVSIIVIVGASLRTVLFLVRIRELWSAFILRVIDPFLLGIFVLVDELMLFVVGSY